MENTSRYVRNQDVCFHILICYHRNVGTLIKNWFIDLQKTGATFLPQTRNVFLHSRKFVLYLKNTCRIKYDKPLSKLKINLKYLKFIQTINNTVIVVHSSSVVSYRMNQTKDKLLQVTTIVQKAMSCRPWECCCGAIHKLKQFIASYKTCIMSRFNQHKHFALLVIHNLTTFSKCTTKV